MNAPHPSPPLSRLLELTADAVAAVLAGRSLTDALAACAAPARPGVQALSFTVMRRLGAAQAVRARLAPKAPPPVVDALLCSAIALLWPDDAPPYPDHTLVDQAVTAARRKVPAASGFLNAVLRRFIRERAALVQEVSHEPVAAWNHPLWWIERLRHDWPGHWTALLQQAQQRPPMTLRVNRRHGTRDTYLARLQAAGLAARAMPDSPDAVLLAQPVGVEQLPGFAQGDVSVQDLAAQRAAPLLLGAGLAPGARVLDACAAPGGKTAHLLECADLNLLALDTDAARLARVDDTLRRLGLAARTQAADARRPASWWDGQPFDAIMLDAPCSGSGVVRRHPDIRWLRRPEDIAALAAVQAELLEALWPLLAPGGRLLYATCSIFRAEGDAQIDAFLQRHGPGGARLEALSPGHLLPLPDNRATVTEASPADGFYYALLSKPRAP
ncbi:16S rRNA (cytosine(967)-C(5))-methyltransferase RsmB [Ideonella alba]|uniref:16S rRNA (cytosine(967)-C(5))-methyltransferase n=1 Tax=Ideonella alba TaxID=2824118 RepID=A0A940Y5S3_9BURK|nr:16S rRNA (cytosine(967)-C(5))-methyltransferase RsmB [Ideonella alba]MBQ0929226.1 16S rRNA (cytosine(967)-C(5))-methyltransferase RsmB [Ideonella alba]